MLRITLLLLLVLSAFSEDVITDFVHEPVWISFELTVENRDKGTKETTNILLQFTLKEWQNWYRKLTQQEVNTFKQFGIIKANPVTIVIQTI
jgi:P2-related tail formation protein